MDLREQELVCSTKKRYATQGDVRLHLKARKDRAGHDAGYYPCPVCDGWHITRAKSNHEGRRGHKKPFTFRDRMRGRKDKYGIRR